MIHDIPKPEISPDFTIDDIHIIRAWNYERLRDATVEERLADNRRRAAAARARIESAGQTPSAYYRHLQAKNQHYR